MLSIKVPAAEGEDQVEGELSGASGSVSLFSEVSPLNDKPHVLVSSAIRGLRAGMEVAISVVSQSDGVINLWGDNTYIGFTSGDLEGWTDGDDEMSLAEIGGTGHNIISVGAYVSRDSFTPEGYTSPVSTGEVLGHIATFSSKGPSADGRHEAGHHRTGLLHRLLRLGLRRFAYVLLPGQDRRVERQTTTTMPTCRAPRWLRPWWLAWWLRGCRPTPR